MGSYAWVSGSHGSVPPNAVLAGRDIDGAPLYVGRAFHEGDLVPCKIAPHHGAAYIPFAGGETTKHEYEVLCSANVAWQFARNGEVPHNAIVAGTTREGEKLYIGRIMHEGSLTPGKIHPSHGCLYIPFGGQEVRHHEYEVAVQM
ncbi:natterin-4-like isoform X2 [Planococcus citri]